MYHIHMQENTCMEFVKEVHTLKFLREEAIRKLHLQTLELTKEVAKAGNWKLFKLETHKDWI